MSTEQTLITQSPATIQTSEVLIPTATIIYHPNLERIGEEAPLLELKQHQSQDISRLTPDFSQPSTDKSCNIADPYISRKPLTLSLVNGGLRIEKSAELTGKVSVNDRLLITELFIVGEEWRNGVIISMNNRVVLFLHFSPQQRDLSLNKHGLLGESSAICKVRRTIERVADLQVPVLIRGETGTGKELVAQALHNSSPRKHRKFVSVNVGAIPDTLAISEIFGAKKGAFTGASKDRAGYFQQADNSTLFLDEIGDANEQVQVALLRTLETGEVTPVGSTGSIHVDVRLVAATDANLEKKILDERFRSPLLQRLAGFEIRIPPLRSRRDDIGRLFIYFLTIEINNVGDEKHLANTSHHVSFWASVFEKACLYNWPGNIRQLKNIAQQLAIYNRDAEQLTIPDHILELFSLQPKQNVSAPETAQTANTPDPLTEDTQHESTPASPRRKPSTVTEQELLDALEAQRWDLKGTAERLNISRAALYKIIDNNPSVRTASDFSLEELNSAYQKSDGDIDVMVDKLKVSKAALKRRLKDLSLN